MQVLCLMLTKTETESNCSISTFAVSRVIAWFAVGNAGTKRLLRCVFSPGHKPSRRDGKRQGEVCQATESTAGE